MHPLLQLLIDRIPEGVSLLKQGGLDEERASIEITTTLMSEFHEGIKMLETVGGYEGDTKKECETFIRKLNSKIRSEIERQYGIVSDSVVPSGSMKYLNQSRDRKNQAMIDLVEACNEGEDDGKAAEIRDRYLIEECENFILFLKHEQKSSPKQCLREVKQHLLDLVTNVNGVKKMRGQFSEQDQRDAEHISRKVLSAAKKKIEEVYGVKFKKRRRK